MNHVPEPLLKPVQINDLRPTQMTVGMREVASKRKRWRELNDSKDAKFLGSHMIPVILGPKNRNFIIDHHHLARALHEEGVREILVTVVADFSMLEKDAFFVLLDNRSWIHPFDSNGKRCSYSKLPKSIEALKDDPYRSMAGELRRLGGYAKDTAPFNEFLWADFLRRRIKRKNVDKNFEGSVEAALQLAKSSDAAYLPGWCGPAH